VKRVRVLSPQEREFHLVTSREDLPAEIIGLIYRQRWKIEVCAVSTISTNFRSSASGPFAEKP
jgi:hypothetical protein